MPRTRTTRTATPETTNDTQEVRRTFTIPARPEGYTIARIRSAARELAEYPESYQECRGAGHWWKEDSDQRRIVGQIQYQTFECQRGCGKTRYDVFTKWGQLVSRSYRDPEGFKIEGAGSFEHPLNKQFWRALAFLRANGEI